jgi:type IV secretory pathway component VirB8
MKTKLALAAALATALVTPVLAADEFYIVQDSATKKCTIVSEKPTTTTTTVVGNGMFKTRVDAEKEMKTTKVCTTK